MFEEVSGIYIRAVIERLRASGRAHVCFSEFQNHGERALRDARQNSKIG